MNRRQWEHDDEQPEEYAIILPFIDQSAEYALGFEAGTMYGRLTYGTEEYQQTVHTENLGQLRAVAQSVGGWDVRFEPLDDVWSVMHVARAHLPKFMPDTTQ